jgi:outer membrane lipoprotein SlyB
MTTDTPRRTTTRASRFAAGLLLLGGLAGCAPVYSNTTYAPYAVGRPAAVSYGTIVGLRPVTVQGGQPGIGTAAGAVAGGVAGSFIGGDWRSNLLGGLGGAVLGGVVGNAVERGTSTGQAVEFFVRQDGGGDISVVQSNEENLQYNDRVVIIHGDTTRISRAGGEAPPLAAAPPPAPYPSAHPAPGGPAYYEQAPQGVRTYTPSGVVYR